MPDAKMRTYPVVSVVSHGPGLKSFRFEKPFAAKPGQFVNVWLPEVGEKPISISELNEKELELTVKAVGPFTRRMMEVQAGDWLGLRGPYGSAFGLKPDALLVAGGVGLAPLRFLSRTMERAGWAHRLLVGIRTASELAFPADYRDRSWVRLASDDGSVGTQGLVTKLVEAAIEERRPRVICAAGPEPMLLAVRELALKAGIPHELSFERYMKCGVGICGQCCLDGEGLRMCVEGPVLDERQLQKVTELGKPHRSASGRRVPRV